MGRFRFVLPAALMIVSGLAAAADASPILGQIDDFEDGTTQNWVINLLGTGAPPPGALPVNLSSGGPAGTDDNFLRLTSVGGGGAGSRLTALNVMQWTGDYLTSGITAISMDVRNLGTTDLELRLLFEDPMGGAPENIAASTDSIFVPGGSGWTQIIFPITPSALTALTGDVNEVLANTTVLRLFHGPLLAFPGPPSVALLDIDNITATQVQAPEPAALALLGLAAAALARRRNRQP